MTIYGTNKFLNADFSVEEMAAIENPEEKRKYFILRYFVPVAISQWQNSFTRNTWATLHIMKSPDIDFYFPFISYCNEQNKRLNQSTSSIWYDENQYVSEQFTSSVGAPNGRELSRQLQLAFNDCFDRDNINAHSKLSAPLIATIFREESSATCKLMLNIVVKTRATVRVDSALSNQAHARHSHDLLGVSEKYKRVYNKLTGEWLGICPENYDCADCATLRGSIAKDNAFDDKELY